MYKYIEKLQELRVLKRQEDEINKKKSELTKPILTDYSWLPILHKTYIEVTGGDDRDPETRSVFLLLMAYLYSPHALAGYKCRRYYRKKLATLFSFVSPCTISINTSTAVFQYLHYSWFRERVEGVFDEMLRIFEKKEPKLFADIKNSCTFAAENNIQ